MFSNFLVRCRGFGQFRGQTYVLIGWALVLSAATATAAPGPSLDPYAIEGAVAEAFSVTGARQVPAMRATGFDAEAVRIEDESRQNAGLPPRFALPESVWLTPADGGVWEELDQDYVLWRARISAPGATSLNLGFTGFRLPKMARVNIYPADVKGPDDARGVFRFTAADNETHGQLWTPVVLSDEIIIELLLPRDEQQNYVLELTSLNQGYRYFGAELDEALTEKAGTCNVDVVCPEGDNWRDEINTVGVISTGGSTFCTGAMVNNTAQDGTPYFLTANHCGINAGNAPSLIVYWNFQSPNCGDQSGGLLTQFSSGATFLAASATSDFTLVEMDDPVDPAHGVNFAGWDWSSTDPVSATAIHHPSGDEKSISFEYDPTSTTSYLENAVPGDGSHIRVTDWDVGTTEPGSSGSPLFDQNHHLVGQLHGGYAACGNNSSDWYGRLSVSWPDLAVYLDPVGTGQTSLDTYVPSNTGLRVSSESFAAIGNFGGPFTPASHVFVVTNLGAAPLTYLAAANVGWLDLGGAGGTLAAGASDSVVVSFNAAANLLVNGNYTGTVSFTNQTTGDGSTARIVGLAVGIPQVFHSFALDTDPGWTGDGDWAWGTPLGGAGDHGLADPTAGFTGSHVLGYNLAGGYPANLPETHLVSRAIDCSGVTGASLRFRRWLNVEQSSYDHASVAVSTDSVNFVTVWQNTAEVTDNAWLPVSYDISAVADNQPTVYLRWTMGSTDESWQYAGWNIDDIEIWGVAADYSTVPDAGRAGLTVSNYPNPFNPSTRVSYYLATSGLAQVRVYDLQGRLVRELFKGQLAAGAGNLYWDGRAADGQLAASGVYFVQFLAGGQRTEHKMVLLK